MVFLVLIWNSLAVIATVAIYEYTGVNNFKENGFITIFSVIQLLVISWLAFKIFQARRVGRVRPFLSGSSAVWIIISVGFLFLAADDFFKIHEKIDHQIHRIFNITETPLTDSIDDVLIGLYGLIGIGVLIAYRNELKAYREARPFFTCGFIFMFFMVMLDILTNRRSTLQIFFDGDLSPFLHLWLSHLEDSLKIFAEAFFILAFYSIYRIVSQTTNKG